MRCLRRAHTAGEDDPPRATGLGAATGSVLYPPESFLARQNLIIDKKIRRIIDHASVQDIAVVAASLSETKWHSCGEEETRRFISHLSLKVDWRMSNPRGAHPSGLGGILLGRSKHARRPVGSLTRYRCGELGGASALHWILSCSSTPHRNAGRQSLQIAAYRNVPQERLSGRRPPLARSGTRTPARMTAAALANWRERELVVLLGTHARSESYFKLLPATLLWHVLGFVSE